MRSFVGFLETRSGRVRAAGRNHRPVVVVPLFGGGSGCGGFGLRRPADSFPRGTRSRRATTACPKGVGPSATSAPATSMPPAQGAGAGRLLPLLLQTTTKTSWAVGGVRGCSSSRAPERRTRRDDDHYVYGERHGEATTTYTSTSTNASSAASTPGATAGAGYAGGRSPIPLSPLDVAYQKESILRLLAYPVGTYTPETFYEAEDLLNDWSLMRTSESVSLTVRLLDRMLLVEDDGSNMVVEADLVNRVFNNWRVLWWTTAKDGDGDRTADPTEEEDPAEGDEEDASPSGYAVHELTPRAMFQRAMDYLSRSDASVNEKTLYLVLEAAVSNGHKAETAELGRDVWDAAVQHARARASSSSITDANDLSPLLPSTDLCNLVMRAQVEGHDDDRKSAGSERSVPIAAARAEAALERGGDDDDKDGPGAAVVRYCEEDVVATMKELDIPMNRITYHRLLQAHAMTKSLAGALAAERLLRRMQELHSHGGDDAVEPSYFTYVRVVTAWAESGAIDAGPRAEALFREVVANSAESELCAKHVAVLNKVLKCYELQGSVKGGRRALALLRQQEHVEDQKPNHLSYSTVLSALSRAGLAPEAEELLMRVPEEYLDPVLFTKVISGLARDKRPSALARARAVFGRMKALAATNPHLNPNLYAYNALLDCYAKCKGQGYVATEATLLLEELQAQGLTPNLMTYSSLLHCWARFGLVNQSLELLNRVPNPDLYLYNIVLSAFIKCGDPLAAPRALQILRRMPEHGIEPDTYSYNSVISAFANHDRRAEGTTNARQLLNELKDRYRQTGEARWRPNFVTYNAVMNAYARAHRPHDAEGVLTDMFDDFLNRGNTSARPDVTSFNTVLKAIAFAKNKDGISDRADALVRRMESLASTIPALTPNIITYTTLVLCHGLGGFPHRAEAALRDLQAKHESGELREGPNLKSFQTLRRAWSASHEPDKAVHVERIRKEMHERFGPPPNRSIR